MAVARRSHPGPGMTVADFLQWDDGTDRRYQLIGGVPVAMAPALLTHGELVAAVAAAIRPQLRPPCRVISEAGVRLPGDDQTFYVADLAVVCGPRLARERYTSAPVLLVEVLSPSTEGRDQAEKVPRYRTLPSVREILVLASDEARAELYRRTPGGWQIEDERGIGAVLRLDSIDADLPLASIYGDIDFSASAAPL